MSKERLTGKRAVWFGLLGTPVLLVAAITLLGVTAGSAGPSTAAKPATAARASQVVGEPVSDVTALGSGEQTFAELQAYWTPERMANAQPYPMTTSAQASTSDGSVQSVPQTSGSGQIAMMAPSGGVETASVPIGQTVGALTEPFHADIPFTRWQWFGRYLRNVPAGSPNMVISTVHKMFFTQDHDGNGTTNDFVCSSSSIGADGIWTAGHCVDNGLNGAGANGGASTNMFFCPSYDSNQGGVNPTAGCWGASERWYWSTFRATGDADYDFGGADATDNPIIGPQAGLIGNYTGWNGLSWNFGNVHWMAFGYPAGAPFNGGTIMTCASSLGYIDEWFAGNDFSLAMGCDMTGGSSGGPWIMQFGRPTQPGGLNARWLNGHNDWRHNAEPGEMNTPYFDERACLMYEAINDVDLGNCP
jgi:hypothetical protein